jgi:hypothetical protein
VSFPAVMFLLGVAALLAGRTISHRQDDECGMHLAHGISGITYLTLLIWGTLPIVALWSIVRAFKFQFYPDACQRQRHEYYPEALLPVVAVITVLLELGGWAFFQWIR